MAACRLNGKAGTLHLTIEQGATFDPVLTWGDENGLPIDLTGYSARMQIRETVDAVAALPDATTVNGQIILGGAAGTVTFAIPATITAAFTFEEAVYDLEVESAGGHVTRLVEGSVYLSPEVTR